MPLDKIQARKLVNAVETAYARSPHAEFIGRIATQLKVALDEVDGIAANSLRAQNEVARLGRELDEEKTHYRKLREQSAQTEAMIALLREIAASPKGAQKKAAEMLKIVAGEEKVVPMEPVKAVGP